MTTLLALTIAALVAWPAWAQRFNYHLYAEPITLHPVMANDPAESKLATYLHGYLCRASLTTGEIIPDVAEKIEVSGDGLTYIFYLRKNVKFHDESIMTADDVEFSFRAIREPEYHALSTLPYLETFEKVEVINKYKISFTAKEKYFKSLASLCGIMKIIPKSVYGILSRSLKLQKVVVGLGPYRLERYEKGQSIQLTQFKNWYGRHVPDHAGEFNFEKILFRINRDDGTLGEHFKKRELDFAEIGSDTYLKFRSEKISPDYAVVKIKNQAPQTYYFVGMNMKNKILSDIKVRKSLAYLFDRKMMNVKFKDGLAEISNGAVANGSPQSPDSPVLEFSPGKASALLREAGWSDDDKNGVLEKKIDSGKVELKLALVYYQKNSEKYWTYFRETLKKSGIELELKFLETNVFAKVIDEKNFDLASLGFNSGDLEDDPKQIWHSSAIGKGGSNFLHYVNPKVDRWIDEGRRELDPGKRSALFKKAYGAINDDFPAIFTFRNQYTFYIKSSRVKSSSPTLKFGIGETTWSISK